LRGFAQELPKKSAGELQKNTRKNSADGIIRARFSHLIGEGRIRLPKAYLKGERILKTKNNQTTISTGMKVKSKVKAGGVINHNQTVVRSLRVKSNIKAGSLNLNHNQTVRKG
jgi:hypothetical protein